MRSALKIFLVFSFLVLYKLQFSNPAFATFIKNSNNPILSVGAIGQWDSLSISDPDVTYDGTGYKMWYSGTNLNLNGSIGYAASADGLLWAKITLNPVFIKDSGDPSELEVGTPNVLKIGNEYKMWYLSTALYSGPGNEVYRIKLASSPNGFDNWTRYGFVFRRSSASWESEGVVPGTIMFLNNQYQMWYSARNSVGTWQIGYAYSSDGINWTREPNPVLTASLSWEGTTVAASNVIYKDGIYHMYYHAGPVVPLYIGHAVSSDGINWTKDPDPILQRGGFADFDRNMIAAPTVIRVANKLRMYYAGHDGANWRIGVAEELLPVPYFSQSDPLWAYDIYDNAPDWAENKNYVDMSSYGCAVTSTAMVLKYFNVQKTPGNPLTGLPPKDLTPGTLNEWLKDVSDGNFRNGVTNFASIAVMTTKAHELDPTSPKLEYEQGFSTSEIDTELENDRKPMLKLEYPQSPSNMHFVVATGSANNTHNILDPFYQDRTTLSPHYSTVLRVDKFIPTNSDFSYLIFAVDQEADLQLLNSNNEAVGEIQLEAPIFDQVNQTSSGAETLKVIYFKHPPTENYTLKISSPSNQSYQLDSYVYNQNGVGEIQTSEGVTGPTDTDSFSLNYDKEATESSELAPVVTFDSLQSDIASAYELGWITNKGVYNSLFKKVEKAEMNLNSGDIIGTQDLLNSLQNELSAQRGKYITEDGYLLLFEVTQNLLNSL